MLAATQREERFQDAPHPATVLMPSMPKAAASAVSASDSRMSAEISGSPVRSMSRSPVASLSASGRPQYLSSGTARAIATQRSASAFSPSGDKSAPDTCACRLPYRQRRATERPSSRSMLSSAPSRTETLTPSLSPIRASAASAPSFRQWSSSPASNSAGGILKSAILARWTLRSPRATAQIRRRRGTGSPAPSAPLQSS